MDKGRAITIGYLLAAKQVHSQNARKDKREVAEEDEKDRVEELQCSEHYKYSNTAQRSLLERRVNGTKRARRVHVYKVS